MNNIYTNIDGKLCWPLGILPPTCVLKKEVKTVVFMSISTLRVGQDCKFKIKIIKSRDLIGSYFYTPNFWLCVSDPAGGK